MKYKVNHIFVYIPYPLQKVCRNPLSDVMSLEEMRQKAETQFGLEIDGVISIKSVFNRNKPMDKTRVGRPCCPLHVMLDTWSLLIQWIRVMIVR